MPMHGSRMTKGYWLPFHKWAEHITPSRWKVNPLLASRKELRGTQKDVNA